MIFFFYKKNDNPQFWRLSFYFSLSIYFFLFLVFSPLIFIFSFSHFYSPFLWVLLSFCLKKKKKVKNAFFIKCISGKLKSFTKQNKKLQNLFYYLKRLNAFLVELPNIGLIVCKWVPGKLKSFTKQENCNMYFTT